MSERGPNTSKNLLYSKGTISNWQGNDVTEKTGENGQHEMMSPKWQQRKPSLHPPTKINS